MIPTAQQRVLQRWFADRVPLDDTSEDWRSRALCASVDPERWFPEKGGDPTPAQAICAVCPVREQCLAYALANNETFGVWGGVTAKGRMEIARSRRTANLATHCKQDHEFTPENTLIKQGFRRCRTCANEWGREYQRKQREAGKG